MTIGAELNALEGIPADREGAVYWRPLPDGYEIVVYPTTFGRVRLCYSQQNDPNIIDVFCYEDPAIALVAAALWNGEGDPIDGWNRHPQSGRRRPGGDPTKETVRE